MFKPFLKTYLVNPAAEKKALVIGGVHGNEYTPLYSLMTLNTSILSQGRVKDDKNIQSITLLNGINYTGIMRNTREIQPQKESISDLNRMFEAEDEKSKGIFDLLKEQIDSHDIIIDVHASDGMINECILIDCDENAYPYIAWAKLARVKYALRYNDNQTIKKYAIRQGKVGVTVEINGLIPIDRVSAIEGVKIIASLLHHYSPEIFVANYEKQTLAPMKEMRASRSGIYSFPYIYDFEGNILEDFSAYKDKVIVKNNNQVWVSPEDYLFYYQEELS